MTPLRRFAPSPLKGGRHLWPGEARSTVSLNWDTAFDLRFLLSLKVP